MDKAMDDIPGCCIESADHGPVSITTTTTTTTKGFSGQEEKQITIDPASFVSREQEVWTTTTSSEEDGGIQVQGHLPPPSPARNRFLSLSLPNSVTSSPRFASSFPNKKNSNKNRWSTVDDIGHIPHQTASPYLSAIMLPANLTSVRGLHRSKSCGEGRASIPSVDFDIIPLHPMHASLKPSLTPAEESTACRSANVVYSEEEDPRPGKGDCAEQQEQEFRCGALCLFLPGFGKAKTVKAKKDGQAEAVAPTVVSRTVSMEKFECGSWASVGINTNNDEGEQQPSSGNLYFDLPLELIRGSKNDMDHPVAAAFVFDKDLKGVLRNGSRSSTWRRPSRPGSPPRHVRFSTSSLPASPAASTCVTPRLHKARAEFMAFLEAQTI